MPELIPAFSIAPGIQPGFWVFAPKDRTGWLRRIWRAVEANEFLRAPSPVIRVEQGDTVQVILENTHYFPHTIHFHGVDHPYSHHEGHGNDGVPETSELPVMPGESRTYEFSQLAEAALSYRTWGSRSRHKPRTSRWPRDNRAPCSTIVMFSRSIIFTWGYKACSWSKRIAPTIGYRH